MPAAIYETDYKKRISYAVAGLALLGSLYLGGLIGKLYLNETNKSTIETRIESCDKDASCSYEKKYSGILIEK